MLSISQSNQFKSRFFKGLDSLWSFLNGGSLLLCRTGTSHQEGVKDDDLYNLYPFDLNPNPLKTNIMKTMPCVNNDGFYKLYLVHPNLANITLPFSAWWRLHLHSWHSRTFHWLHQVFHKCPPITTITTNTTNTIITIITIIIIIITIVTRLWAECIIVRPCTATIVSLTFAKYSVKLLFPECDPPDERLSSLSWCPCLDLP